MAESKSILKSLFDFSFKQVIAPRVLRFLYALITILMSIVLIIVEYLLVGDSLGLGKTRFLVMILAPLGYLLYLMIVRVLYEYWIVIFNINDNTEKMAAK